jgi:hypothetical protein
MPTNDESQLARLPAQPTASLEELSFMNGLYREFIDEKHRYHQLTAALMEAQGRVELAEGRLRLTRDHMLNRFSRAPMLAPQNWREEFLNVRFVGVRVGDACLSVLAEEGKATTEGLVQALNEGGFRFRTNAPAREVHAALIRQPQVTKKRNEWVFTGEREAPMTMDA